MKENGLHKGKDRTKLFKSEPEPKINDYNGFASGQIYWTWIFNTREKLKPWSKADIVVGNSSLPQISLYWLKTVVHMVSYKQPWTRDTQ